MAEGVETRAQLLKLNEVGCDMLPGYFLAQPEPANNAALTIFRKSGPALGLT